ncbi:hypothetical protein R70723_31845 [Paenibacillus sp. FSL R7-0273]|uniref:hypothetical protein n=1 Tax=Paenibacillus sp. FSL R7-0273 TaxID=1536772 RepID=UPI0004F772E2|nr:hypothetical protein [Paenibacillus sp. FSL R7-0273]AIQ49963.1 hypothetical protein R70723_31845 [Paenibacillus sp. FSL R7-0273]OMF84537.1 hypothetical protein BK144_29890 [Paenibacillus sp. FSL R7-0273]
MNKPDQQQWKRYVQGEITGPERVYMDRLLLEDFEALDSYMTALELHSLPQLPDRDGFADQIMEQLAPLSPAAGQKQASSGTLRLQGLLRNQWLHYITAACITMLFISAGVFDRMAPGNIGISAQTKQPYSEKMVEKATGWLKEIKPAPYTITNERTEQ